jgi:hypothetical protein
MQILDNNTIASMAFLMETITLVSAYALLGTQYEPSTGFDNQGNII